MMNIFKIQRSVSSIWLDLILEGKGKYAILSTAELML